MRLTEGPGTCREPPEEGLMCECLWSDPQPFPGRAPSKRGIGVAFGPAVTRRFLTTNSLALVVRSHEVGPPWPAGSLRSRSFEACVHTLALSGRLGWQGC